MSRRGKRVTPWPRERALVVEAPAPTPSPSQITFTREELAILMASLRTMLTLHIERPNMPHRAVHESALAKVEELAQVDPALRWLPMA